MTLKLRFVRSKPSFQGASRQKYAPERCASNRWAWTQNGLWLFRSAQVAFVARPGINFFVHETKLARYHLNS